MKQTRMQKYYAVKVKGRGFVKVTKDNGNFFNYKILEFKCVRDIDKAELFSADPRKSKRTLPLFEGLVDADKLELVEHYKEVEYMTLSGSPL